MPEETDDLPVEGAESNALVEAPAGTLPPPAEPETEHPYEAQDEPDAEPVAEQLFCPQCGARMLSAERFCGNCGWDAERPEEAPPPNRPRREPPPTPRRTGPPSDYNRLTTFLLCLLLGYFGVHRFYVGRVGSGILWLLTGGVLAVGWIYDLVMIATGEFVDQDGKRIVYWQ
jgi:TM2 domain-containing membrane protein YozV